MKEQKTASEYIETVYGASRFTRTLAVGDTQSIVDLMQDFSDQQNAELRERVKELEAQNDRYRKALEDVIIRLGEDKRFNALSIAKEALKQQ